MPYFRAVMFFRDTVTGNEYRNTFIGSAPTQLVFNAEVFPVALNAYWNTLKPTTHTRVEFYRQTSQDLNTPKMPIIPVALTSSAGTNISDPYNTSVGALLTFRSNSARPNQKRLYVTPTTEDQVSAGVPSPLYVTALIAAAQGLVAFAQSPGYQSDLGCARLKPDGTVLSYHPYESFSLSTQLAVQRRRKVGVGI